MAEPLNIPIVRHPDYQFGDTLILFVNSVQQPDLVMIWDPTRQGRGYGFGPAPTTAYGLGQNDPAVSGYGNGAYGAGLYGQGAGLLTHATLNSFVAGDYAITAQAQDALGNVGTLSAAATIQHRPDPPPPFALTITPGSGTLSWSWSDP